MIQRLLGPVLRQRLHQGKVIVLLGPRQVGKTTLVRHLSSQIDATPLYLNADDASVPQLLGERNAQALRGVLQGYDLVVIDEAQRIPEIGLKLKLLVDNYPELQLLVTGSSSLELAQGTSESLTGRKFEFTLYPISFVEYAGSVGRFQALSNLTTRLVYGSYPEVVENPGREEEILRLLTNSYLYKDILELTDIRRVELLRTLLQYLALQVSSEVNYTEIGRNIGADKETVERYIYLLEQSFVIFRLTALSRNVRTEIKRGRKIYFWDNGIRNALIANFNPLTARNDTGALWENFLVSERQKRNRYAGKSLNIYFWRTHQQQEIDYIEEYGGRLHAYEFTYNPKRKKKISATFLGAYPESSTEVINRDNFWNFLTDFDR